MVSSGAGNHTIENGKNNHTISRGSYTKLVNFLNYETGSKYKMTATLEGTSDKLIRFRDDSLNAGGLTVGGADGTTEGIVRMTGSAQEISIEWTALTRSDEFILERHSGGDYSFTLDDLVISKFNSNATDSFGGISATVSLTKSSVTNGSITAESSYAKNSKATVTATADTGYLFTAWTGANTGSTNPLTLTMDDNKTIGATFSKDTRDTDSDGLTNYQEIVIFATNPNTPNPNLQYLSYGIVGDSITITGCDTAASGALVIPDTIAGKPVTAIGDNAFYDCSNLTLSLIHI